MAEDILRDEIPNQVPQIEAPAKKSRQKKIKGIRQRGKRWLVDATYKYIRLQESFATLEMAEAYLRKKKIEIDENRHLDVKRESTYTLKQFKERYLQWCEDIRQKTAYDKGVYFKPILAHFGEDVLLARITRADIEEYQAKRLALPGVRRRTIKPATVNREIATLKHMFSKAVEWKQVEISPARGIKMLKEINRRLRYLTAEECKTLLDACPTPTLRQVVELAINTGMRKGEILNLKWENVNLKDRYIELTIQKNGERSTVPLNQTVVDLLRSIPRRLDSDYVFTGKNPGEPYYDLKRQFEDAIKAAKLDGVTFHTLRHYLPFLTMFCPAMPATYFRELASGRSDIVLTPLSSPCGRKGVHHEMGHQSSGGSVASTGWPARGTHRRVCQISKCTGLCPLFDSPAGFARCVLQQLAQTEGSRFTPHRSRSSLAVFALSRSSGSAI